MRDQDRQFFDTFMLVLGILIGVAVGLFFLVRAIAIDTQGRFVMDDPQVQQEIDARIQPVGHVVLAGSEELTAAEAKVQGAGHVEAPLSGPQVYNAQCHLCHGAPGVGGAPVFGNAEAWDPRIEKGMDTLVDHALHGFQGDAGFMPPKGGRVDLSDDEIKAAVQYMVDQVEPQ